MNLGLTDASKPSPERAHGSAEAPQGSPSLIPDSVLHFLILEILPLEPRGVCH